MLLVIMGREAEVVAVEAAKGATPPLRGIVHLALCPFEFVYTFRGGGGEARRGRGGLSRDRERQRETEREREGR